MAKGNDGSAARRRTMRKLLIAIGIALGVTFVIIFFEGSENNAERMARMSSFSHKYKNHGGFSPDVTGSRHGGHRHGHHNTDMQQAIERLDRGGDGGAYDRERDDTGRGFQKFPKGGRRGRNFADGFGRGHGRGDDGPGHNDVEWGNREEHDDISFDSTDDDLAAKYQKDLIYDGQINPRKAKNTLERILNGSIHLVDVGSGPSLHHTDDGSYEGVIGKFCKLDFSLYENNPEDYPMFRFLVWASQDCNGNEMYFDIKKVAYLARRRDQEVERSSDEGPKALNITAVAFHESRCGSTLVANSMIAMDPVKHRSYSESKPAINALYICDEDFSKCSQEQAAAVLKDTMYLMSRSDDHREERSFFKFQSIASQAIRTFQIAFPDVPWMYIYRDPVQVMMSHVKDDPSMKRTICTKTRRFPPAEIHAIAKRHGRSVHELSGVEYCAAYLSLLTETAVYNLNDMAIPVLYHQLPNIMWEEIMPKIFGRPLKQFEIDNLEAISQTYSKGQKYKGEYKDDSKEKEKLATDEVREAADEFLKESYDQLIAFEPKLLK
jgi:hypothetical protein